jgi:hypothetical protein
MMVVFSLAILSLNSFTFLEKDLNDLTFDSISKSVMSLFMKDQFMMNNEGLLNQDAYKEFISFIVKHGRNYESKDHHTNRFNIFRENYLRMVEHNKKGSEVSFKMGVNRFSDMTEEEFLDLYNNPALSELTPSITSEDIEQRQLFLKEKKL